MDNIKKFELESVLNHRADLVGEILQGQTLDLLGLFDNELYELSSIALPVIEGKALKGSVALIDFTPLEKGLLSVLILLSLEAFSNETYGNNIKNYPFQVFTDYCWEIFFEKNAKFSIVELNYDTGEFHNWDSSGSNSYYLKGAIDGVKNRVTSKHSNPMIDVIRTIREFLILDENGFPFGTDAQEAKRILKDSNDWLDTRTAASLYILR